MQRGAVLPCAVIIPGTRIRHSCGPAGEEQLQLWQYPFLHLWQREQVQPGRQCRCSTSTGELQAYAKEFHVLLQFELVVAYVVACGLSEKAIPPVSMQVLKCPC